MGTGDEYLNFHFIRNRPLSLGGRVESRGNKKLCFLNGKPRPDANSVRG